MFREPFVKNYTKPGAGIALPVPPGYAAQADTFPRCAASNRLMQSLADVSRRY